MVQLVTDHSPAAAIEMPNINVSDSFTFTHRGHRSYNMQPVVTSPQGRCWQWRCIPQCPEGPSPGTVKLREHLLTALRTT